VRKADPGEGLMLAAYAAATEAADPLSGLAVGDLPEPDRPPGWVEVEVRAAALNHHDVWSLRGIGLGEEHLPMVLGCDAAGVDPDGNEVIVHALVGDPEWRGDETLDPARSLLSEKHFGTFAESVVVPRRNLVPKPSAMSWEHAACLPTAYLTAFRMLFVKSGLVPGQRVLVQGCAGGVASAAIGLASVAGLEVWATTRSESKREFGSEIGAHQVFLAGARLPGQVDAVIDTVGEATWSHSLKSLRRGGRLVVAGATSGPDPGADLFRVFLKGIDVMGSTMGTRDELCSLVKLLELTGLRPLIDRAIPLDEVKAGIKAMVEGDVWGKVVLRMPSLEREAREALL
jgi:NADPH:quinone reductase-like Zn-dependent oxidoreductase